MNKIETIMNDLSLPEKKKALVERKSIISKIRYTMSCLLLNKMVALYARNLEILENEENEERIKNIRLENVILLKKEPEVEAYESLRKDLKKLEGESYDYYRSLQTDLRDALLEVNLPEIYVYQGMIGKGEMELCRHIIIPGIFQAVKEEKEVEKVVHPYVPTESRRKLNHFYNRTSLRYLDEMVDDFSFSLETKNLGRVR